MLLTAGRCPPVAAESIVVAPSMTAPRDRDHWPRHARQWALVGPPLRPGPEDVAAVMAAAAAWEASAGRPPRVLVLGVTPELVGVGWATPPVAIERSAAVIGALVQPGRARPLQADWCALPLADASIDLVLGDGSPSSMVYPGPYRRLAAEVARVLAPGGRLVLRLFAAPPAREPLAAVADDLAAGRIGSFHALKWRVAMAIQPDERNVAVTDLAVAIDALVPDRAALAARTGWPRPVLDAVDVYRGSPVTYSFPTRAELEAALAPHLVVVDEVTPGYELGERCPTVTWARAADVTGR